MRFLERLGLRPRLAEAFFVACLAAVTLGLLSMAQQPGVFGLYNDDGEYLKGAMALARGLGYVDTSTLEHLTLRFPIGMSALLAPIARACPDLWALIFGSKVLVAVFGVGFVVAAYGYLRRWCGASVLSAGTAALLVALNGSFLEFGTGIMSDVPYACLALVALMVAEQALGSERPRYGREALLGALLAGTLLVRYAGVVLVAALVLEALRRRQPGRLVRTLGVGALCWIPWLVYRSHYKFQGYAQLFADQQSHLLGAGHLVSDASLSCYHLFIDALPSMLLPGWSPGASHTATSVLIEFAVGTVLSAGLMLSTNAWASERRNLSLLGPLYLVLTLGLDVAWNVAYTSLGIWQHLRLILPVLPLVAFVLIREAERLTNRRRMLAVAVVGGLVVASAYQAYTLIERRTTDDMYGWEAKEQLLSIIRAGTPKNAVVLTWYPPLVYMTTGRRALQMSDRPERLVPDILNQGVTFIAGTPELRPDGEDLTRAYMGAFQRSFPGVLHPIFIHDQTHYALWQINRKALIKALEAKALERRSHVGPGIDR